VRKQIDEFLVDLCNDVPAAVVETNSGDGLGVEGFSLALPIESVIRDGGALAVSLPRGRLATGFDVPHGRLQVSFVRSDKP
jgi:hypothetical protein